MTLNMSLKKCVLMVTLAMTGSTVFAIDPPQSVKIFYDNLQRLGTTNSSDEAASAQQSMVKCFHEGDKGGPDVTMDGIGEEIQASTYTARLYRLLYMQKSLKIESCNILKTESNGQPDQVGSRNGMEATHLVSYATKTYVKNGVHEVYNDLITVSNQSGLITEMMNVTSFEGVVQFSQTVSAGETGIEQLRARAAYYYTNKDYETAYKCYEELLKRAPRDGDAAYRIALMTFWRRGCKKRFSKKEAKKVATQYIEIAIEYANPVIKQKAINVWQNWDRQNIYF